MADDMLKAVVTGIEVAVFGAAQAGAPVVFVTHGRGGNRADMYDRCRDLVDDGFVAVSYDQRNHGVRMRDPELNGGWSHRHAADMYGNLVGTAADVSLLIDFLPAVTGIPTTRVGMTGISLGGHATLVAMGLEPRIAVAVPIIGGGDYRHLMALRAEVNGTSPEQFSDYFSPAMEAAVARYDPISHPERYADRPLLLCNGADDTLVQAVCNERFYAAARTYYTDPARLRLSLYPGVGHAVPAEMWEEARAWFRAWLA